MTATYRADHADDPERYERLMRERYGPLDKVMAERSGPSSSARRPPMGRATPDPAAAEHVAELKKAIAQGPVGRLGPAAPIEQRTPPVPGMTWCHACDGWCTQQGICGCNDR
jgi:hypothetical protein